MEKNTFEEGRVILIDKSLGWTSFDVVKKVRNIIKIKKIGHAGTLDPLASGLLILCTGKFTKKIGDYMAKEKEYTGTITLGAVTPTYDLESAPENFRPIGHLTPGMLKKHAGLFTGDILQMPPIYSAIKQKGRPVYIKARRGEHVEMESRRISIKEFDIEHFNAPVVAFRVVCSTGTYIRSLANDFGRSLGCGGYLSSLRRTRIGDISVSQAKTIDTFVEEFRSE